MEERGSFTDLLTKSSWDSDSPKKLSNRLGLLSTPPAYLQKVKTPSTKQSDGEASVMLELWGIRSTPWFPSIPGPLWPGVIALARVLSMDQIEQNCGLRLNWIVWNKTVYMYKNDSLVGLGGLVMYLWNINLCRLFNAKSIFIQIVSSISNNSV